MIIFPFLKAIKFSLSTPLPPHDMVCAHGATHQVSLPPPNPPQGSAGGGRIWVSCPRAVAETMQIEARVLYTHRSLFLSLPLPLPLHTHTRTHTNTHKGTCHVHFFIESEFVIGRNCWGGAVYRGCMPPSLTLEASEQGVDKGIDGAQETRERG